VLGAAFLGGAGVLDIWVPVKEKNKKRKVPTNSPIMAMILLRVPSGRLNRAGLCGGAPLKRPLKFILIKQCREVSDDSTGYEQRNWIDKKLTAKGGRGLPSLLSYSFDRIRVVTTVGALQPR
jgi:hypothetical protein